ncbi:hypothetical protein WMY93_033909 [Mugilogobius chulae]|uniref:exodeoxyribonuclease III n=1 Tax=Mugilogobius chulae TaxID=88201 RepID=A0AAW0MIQ3_9GOBI
MSDTEMQSEQQEQETDTRGETVTSAPPPPQSAEAESLGEESAEGSKEQGSEQCEDEEDMGEDDTLSQMSDVSVEAGQDGPAPYNVKEINEFLDVTYGNKAVNETHSTGDNEADWGRIWPGPIFMSHGTNVSAGVAVLLSERVKLGGATHLEVEGGRLQVVQGTVRETHFVFINIYAHNSPTGRIQLVHKLNRQLKNFNSDSVVIVGGDWNCTTHSQDRNTVEPHPNAAATLASVLRENDLVDTWRQCHPTARQYTWVRVSAGRVSAARLDRIYINQSHRNHVRGAQIIPTGFSDHHLGVMDYSLPVRAPRCPYWRMNLKLLQENEFINAFEEFWRQWGRRKGEFIDVLKWWEVGKTQIKLFVQQYMSFSHHAEGEALKQLEREVACLEEGITRGSGSSGTWATKRRALGSFMNERAKGALVKAKIITLTDIDAPTRYFFNLEKKGRAGGDLMQLKMANGEVTSDPSLMRQEAISFYSKLFAVDECDEESQGQMVEGLPKLEEWEAEALTTPVTLEEMTTGSATAQLWPSPGDRWPASGLLQTFLAGVGGGRALCLHVCTEPRKTSSQLHQSCSGSST